MAVTSVKEKANSGQGSLGEKNREQYQQTFVVLTDDKDDSVATVVNAVLLNRGITLFDTGWVSGNDSSFKAKAKNVTAKETGPKSWEVVVTFDSQQDDEAQQEENPLDRPVQFSASFLEVQVPLEKDRDGNATKNSHNVPFNPPPMVPEAMPVLNARANKAAFDFSLANQYVNTVNNAEWYGVDAGKARVTNITGDGPKEENGYVYYEVSVDVQFNRRGWQPSVLDSHIVQNEKDAASFAQVIGSRVLLDGAGAKNSTDANPVFLDFNYYEETDFNDLI